MDIPQKQVIEQTANEHTVSKRSFYRTVICVTLLSMLLGTIAMGSIVVYFSEAQARSSSKIEILEKEITSRVKQQNNVDTA